MAEQTPIHMIHAFGQRWQLYRLISRILLALTIAAVVSGIIYMVHGSPWWALPVTVAALLGLLLPARSWRVTENDVIRYFNVTYPELEESAGLLLQPQDNLALLEQLQAAKIRQALTGIHPQPPLRTQLRLSIWAFIAGIMLAAAAFRWGPLPAPHTLKSGRPAKTAAINETRPPEIAAVTITIQPPAYTGKSKRQQQQLGLEVEEGATVFWQLHTNQAAASLSLVFNDSLRLPLQPTDKTATLWEGRTTIARNGFYQLQLGGKLSDLYKISIIKDQPPVITIQTPKPYTTIDYGEPQRVALKLNVTDDYGITGATIQATVASGSGEAVKFKEQPIAFDASFGGARTQYALEKSLNLAALGMEPGGELYFYIQATDNHRQTARSGVYMVVLPDTAQLMNIEGMANSLNLKPEYFRSQRQIIIETEQLIRDKDTLSEKLFKSRSNDLGIDQRLLRLRYGKFLGEETETNIGDERVSDEDHDHQSNDAKDFNNAEKIIDQFSHKHDIAEDATFFDPETKSQLKATLTEMWNAELRLRTFKPQEALPYEYKALRLLKDLQQKSRAYVAKTSVKTPPLKPEKRLTGELDRIITPVTQRGYEQGSAATDQLAYALAVLETLKTGGGASSPNLASDPNAIPGPSGLKILQQAAQQMSRQATANPARYLAALQAMRQLITALEQRQPADAAAITLAAQSIYSLLPAPARLPFAGNLTTGISLSQQYFMNLNQP
ncbi:DUF4175 domain-containing protein [Chitinophaga agrisoli]|uniref:DUF4175 domain-containing protein n=1 Tax=Chitinophaga agrisoli TaxID=2607653 RepID=A0A5B2W3P5_9BACT|nr:DUF4175 family protein [Chitinophaga agrisoli]KAA2244899.1 DUF4175 domain-containing protein [Chitinophaga agrisoli]